MDARELTDDLTRETALLRRIARGIVLEPGLAEDVVQEAWLAALKSRPAPERRGGWMTEAVRRIAAGMRRGEARRTAREHSAARVEAQPAAAETAARIELLRGLLEALQRLDEPYRTALQLRLVDDLPPREIARRTGVPVETARTRVKRGVERLRAQLDARHAGRRDELLSALAPLIALGGIGGVLGTITGTKALGGAWMGVNAKIAATAALLVAAGVLWMRPWDSRDGFATVPVSAIPEVAAPPGSTRGTEPSQPAAVAEATDRETVGASESRAASREAEAWTLRGKALLGRLAPLPEARLRVTITSGYDGPGERLHDQVIQADARGAFALELTRPERAVRVRLEGALAEHKSWPRETLVLRGAPPPQDLALSFYPLDVLVSGVVLSEAGEPLPGARVRGLDGEVSAGAGGSFLARGSTQRPELSLHACAPGFAERSVVLRTDEAGARERVEIRLAPGAQLSGRVLDEYGAPIQAAAVASITGYLGKTTTDGDGRFVLDGLPRGEDWLGVAVEAEGFAPFRRDFEDGLIPAAEVVFTLERGREVRGRVVDEHGAAVPGANAHAGRSPYEYEVAHGVADDDGRFVLRHVPTSEEHFGVEADGFAPFVAALEPAGGDVQVLAQLTRGLRIRGEVVDALGTPVRGAGISLRRGYGDYLPNSTARADEHGRFELLGAPSEPGLTLEVYATGFTRDQRRIDPAQAQELRVVMQRAAGFAGRVLDSVTRAPVTDFRVRLLQAELREGDDPLSGYGVAWAEGGIQFSDANGLWDTAREELTPGQVAALEITAPGYGTALVPRVVTVLDPQSQRIEVALDAGLRVIGRVIDARDGRPIGGALVRRFTARDRFGAWRDDGRGTWRTVAADADGAFAFEGLASEPMSLYVEAPGFAPLIDGPFDPSRGELVREVALDQGASVSGVVRDVDGEPVRGAEVRLAIGSETAFAMREWLATTDAEGRFRFERLAPAEYFVSRRFAGGRSAAHDLTRSVRVAGPGEHEVELRPPGTILLRGELRGARVDGPNIVYAVRADGRGPESTREALMSAGRFEFSGMEAGTWKLTVHGTDLLDGSNRRGELTVELGAARTAECVIDY